MIREIFYKVKILTPKIGRKVLPQTAARTAETTPISTVKIGIEQIADNKIVLNKTISKDILRSDGTVKYHDIYDLKGRRLQNQWFNDDGKTLNSIHYQDVNGKMLMFEKYSNGKIDGIVTFDSEMKAAEVLERDGKDLKLLKLQ